VKTAIETSGLGKRYRGTWALREAGLTAPAGRVTALLGPNGAGKTTLLNILAGLTEPTTGAATILGGLPVGSRQARERLAFVAQDTPVFADLRVSDHLRVARDLNLRWDGALAMRRLATLGIPLSKRAGKLSGGQQAQLALTLAMARHPEVLLLDEPMARLDPVARHDFLGALVTAAYEDGISVVFSSHVIPEMERIASYLILLSGGRVQVAGEPDELLDAHQVLTGPAEQATELAERFGAVAVERAPRQAHLLVRYAGDPPAGWAARPAGFEELVIAYLREPGATALPGPGRAVAVSR
jgi:ABC-2 type transport system ATP-binding protein